MVADALKYGGRDAITELIYDHDEKYVEVCWKSGWKQWPAPKLLASYMNSKANTGLLCYFKLLPWLHIHLCF